MHKKEKTERMRTQPRRRQERRGDDTTVVPLSTCRRGQEQRITPDALDLKLEFCAGNIHYLGETSYRSPPRLAFCQHVSHRYVGLSQYTPGGCNSKSRSEQA